MGKTGKVKKHSSLAALALMTGLIPAMVLAGCVEKYETKTVDALVIEKDYDAPKTTTTNKTVDGKVVTKTKHHPAEYDVTIQYKNGDVDVEAEFDDKQLYNRVKEGQTIKVTYEQGLDKDGNLVTERLVLID